MSVQLPADLPCLTDRGRCATPKPVRGALKAATQIAGRIFKRSRSRFRAEIFRLDGGRCRKCQKKLWLQPSQAPHEFAIAHVHEWIKRSLGGDPLSKENCLVLCATCHDLVDDHKLEIAALDQERLMRGEVEFPKGRAA